MTTPLEFPESLRLIDEPSAAFRVAVTSAHSLDVRVPSCPEWTLFRLVEHLGGGDRFRAAVDADGARPEGAPGTADVSVHGTAGDLVLFRYNRVPATSLRIDGDRILLDLLRAWEPEELGAMSR
ncbi:maleylpyruvate isomerase N-terminal domain-containing protein [Streptomyces antibioticus]|uniref:maleylpyruvate isomerase N-terminal domain-containing protein n=1 Tax=Streptomyces antibioticus TaxID=1890 RepID=UPI003D755C91